MTSPNFSTFPEAGLRFLRQLKRNNNRDWFLAHKTEYEECIKKPMEDLITGLAAEFSRFAPEIQASPRTSLYRIYRDTRFSKNKSPYKTHVAAVFQPRGLPRHEGAGFYFHISTDEVLIGGGLYMPLPEDLRTIRETIAADPSRFASILKDRRFRTTFGELSGEQLARVPRGFPPDHRAATHLKFKQYLAALVLPAKSATSPNFCKTLVETFKAATPLIRFLNDPILERRRASERKDSLLL